jgi:hypothetical protein
MVNYSHDLCVFHDDHGNLKTPRIVSISGIALQLDNASGSEAGNKGEQQFQIEKDATVLAAWYQPEDNIRDLQSFHNITVLINPEDPDTVNITYNGIGVMAALQIRLFALYFKAP